MESPDKGRADILGSGGPSVTIYDLDDLLKTNAVFQLTFFINKGKNNAVFKADTGVKYYTDKIVFSDLQHLFISGEDETIHSSSIFLKGQEPVSIYGMDLEEFRMITKDRRFTITAIDGLYQVFNDNDIQDLRCVLFRNDWDVARYILDALARKDFKEASGLSRPARMYSLKEV